MKSKRMALAVLFAVFAGLSAAPAVADPSDKLEEIQAKKAEIRAKRLAAEARAGEVLEVLAGLDAKRARAEARVEELDNRLSILSARIEVVRGRLAEAQKELSLLTSELMVLQRQLVERTDVFTMRAIAAYKAGPTAFLDSALSSDSFTDLVSRFQYHEAALDSDARLIEDIETLRAGTAAHRDAVDERRAQVAQAKLSLEADYEQLDFARAERAAVLAERERAVAVKEVVLAEIEARRDALAAAEAQLESDAAEIHSILAGSSSGAPVGGGQLLWPASGPVTSPYGYRTHPIFGDQRLHTGVDIGAGYGSPVIASDSGYVSYAGVMSGYGNVIVVDHGGGLATTYNHLSAFYVASGQSVGRGTQIGAVGCTGYCTGPHLHFEVRVNGSPVDPMPYLQ
ncbi:MAG TPA: peptidoglycan DD-metalloendopeptidase family protein [Actinomycetota bacterium]|nr:peptidoglycan DD-metalloendopeptidase family protein [Actinomycetota bacterium]